MSRLLGRLLIAALLPAGLAGCERPPADADADRTQPEQASPGAAPRRAEASIPPLTFTRAEDGSRRAVIDHAAFVAFCRAHDLPDPPGVGDVDAAAMEAIHRAAAQVAADRSVAHLVALAYACDGNAVLAAAEPLYAELRERQPRVFEHHALHGRCLAALGRPEEAAGALAAAVALRPDDAATQYRLGDVRLEIGDLDGAEAAFAQCAAQRRGDGLGLFGLGRVAAAREAWERAAPLLDAAVAADPNLKGAWLLLAQVHRRLGRDDAARDAADRAAAIPGRGLVAIHDPVESAMYLASGSTAALEAHVSALAAAGRFVEGYAAAEELLRRRPRDPIVRRNLAQLARGKRELETALGHAEALVALDPGDGTSETLRAVILRDLDRPGPALEAADRAIAAERPDPAASLLRASLLLRLGRGDDALAACAVAEAAMPGSLDPLLMRAGVLTALRRFDEARPVLERILELDPANEWALGTRDQLDRIEEAGGG